MQDQGWRALRVVAARIGWAYCGSVLLTLPVALGPDHPGAALFGAAIALAVMLALGVVRRPPSVAGVALVGVLSALAMVVLPALAAHLGERHTHLLLGFLGNGVVIAVAASWGPRIGGLMIVWIMLAWVSGSLTWGLSPDPLMMFGTGTAGIIGLVAGTMVPRGFRVTSAALAAAESAELAREVAAARWLGQRRQIRQLHDTVLSTLSVLAQGGAGVSAEALRAECAAQAGVLRAAASFPAASADDVGADSAAVGPAASFADLVTRWADRGLTVQPYGDPPADVLAGLGPPVAHELLDALDQCLANVHRHAGVDLCALTLSRGAGHVVCAVVDEGCGFDPDTRAPRVGMTESVRGRITDLGGTVRLWSRPGAGTSVALEVPCPELT